MIQEQDEITRDVRLAIVSTLSDSLDDVNIRAAFTLAFGRFLRSGEFTWDSWHKTLFLSLISRGSVNFTDDGIVLNLPKPKTDQYHQGQNITISPVGDLACPVTALQTLFHKDPQPTTAPLFSRTSSAAFNKQWLTQKLNFSLQAGYNPATYSGHSFRTGATNSPISAGIPLANIKKMGGWKSNAVEKYMTKESTNTLLFAANK
jgi:hypothetical protein